METSSLNHGSLQVHRIEDRDWRNCSATPHLPLDVADISLCRLVLVLVRYGVAEELIRPAERIAVCGIVVADNDAVHRVNVLSLEQIEVILDLVSDKILALIPDPKMVDNREPQLSSF